MPSTPAALRQTERRRAEGTTEVQCCDAIYWSTSCLCNAALLHSKPTSTKQTLKYKNQLQQAVKVNMSKNKISEKHKMLIKAKSDWCDQIFFFYGLQNKNTCMLLHYCCFFYGLKVYSKIIFYQIQTNFVFSFSKIIRQYNFVNQTLSIKKEWKRNAYISFPPGSEPIYN